MRRNFKFGCFFFAFYAKSGPTNVVPDFHFFEIFNFLSSFDQKRLVIVLNLT